VAHAQLRDEEHSGAAKAREQMQHPNSYQGQAGLSALLVVEEQPVVVVELVRALQLLGHEAAMANQ